MPAKTFTMEEIESNAADYISGLPTQISNAKSIALIAPDKSKMAYASVATLQAWRTSQIFGDAADISSAILEAQNDALQSFTLAHLGMWRAALQSLRGCLEGVVRTLFFIEHPVEFNWWQRHTYKLSISATLSDYFPKHPRIAAIPIPDLISFPQILTKEYAELSRAVHASAKSFNMTKAGDIAVSTASPADYGAWFTRHRNTLGGINRLLVAFFAESLRGTGGREIRRALVASEAIPQGIWNDLKTHLGIVLRAK